MARSRNSSKNLSSSFSQQNLRKKATKNLKINVFKPNIKLNNSSIMTSFLHESFDSSIKNNFMSPNFEEKTRTRVIGEKIETKSAIFNSLNACKTEMNLIGKSVN